MTGGFELPLIERGHMDIRETGSVSRREASLQEMSGDVMLAELTAYATGSEVDGLYGFEGVVLSILPGETIDVSLEGGIEPDAGGSRDRIAMSLRMDQRALLMESTFEERFAGGVPAGGSLSTLLDTRAGLVEMSSSLQSSQVTGTISVNGAEYAAFSGPVDFNAPLAFTGVDTNVVTRLDSLMVRDMLNRWYFSRLVPNYIYSLAPLLEPLAARR